MKDRQQSLLWNISPSPEELFNFLAVRVRPPLIMDIGSRDATEAKRFKRLSPLSEVMAVEPHPALFAKMLEDPEIKKLGIRPFNAALSNKEGALTFYINDAKSLNGSLRKTAQTVSEVFVKVQRLDTLTESHADASSIFLWVDVEGLAWEVMAGGSSTLDRVACIHIEYETTVLFEGQKTLSEVKTLLKAKGFKQWADAYCAEVSQGNALFVRSGHKGMSLYSLTLLIAAYPWFMAKALYRKLKNGALAAAIKAT